MAGVQCEIVGAANPDIAGIGILLSFAIQSFISILGSAYCLFLLTQDWKLMRPNQNYIFAFLGPTFLSLYSSATSWQDFKKMLRDRMSWALIREVIYRIYRPIRAPMPQWQPQPGVSMSPRRKKKQDIANLVLVTGSDYLTISGIALLLAAIVQNASLPFYHLHIVFDTASFVFVSNCAAIVCYFSEHMEYKYARYALILSFTAFYIVYTVLFAVRLHGWSPSIEGHCFNTAFVSTAHTAHPLAEYIYIFVTSFYALISLVTALRLNNNSYTSGILEVAFLGGYQTSEAETHIGVLAIAAMQFPVHLYTIFALRSANETSLTSGITEQEWGFGQIVAMVLLSQSVVIFFGELQNYTKWKREVERKEVVGHHLRKLIEDHDNELEIGPNIPLANLPTLSNGAPSPTLFSPL